MSTSHTYSPFGTHDPISQPRAPGNSPLPEQPPIHLPHAAGSRIVNRVPDGSRVSAEIDPPYEATSFRVR